MTTQEDHPQPGPDAPPASPNRDKRREPVIIDASATPVDPEPAVETEAGTAPPSPEPETEPVTAEEPQPAIVKPEPSPAVAPKPAPRSRLPLVAAILGGAVVAIGGATALHMYADNDSAVADLSQQAATLDARLAALEKQSAGAADKAALAALDKRLAALEQKPTPSPAAAAPAASPDALAALEKRLSAAEALAKTAGATADSARSDAQKAAGLATQLANAANQKPDSAGAPPPQIVLPPPPPPVDLGPVENRIGDVEQRLGALEASLNGAKSEIRATQTESAEASSGASRATIPVIAQALLQDLDRGAPFAAEVAALKGVGLDPQRLAALEPAAAKGIPTTRQLADAFSQYSDAIARTDQPVESTSIVDRLKQSAARLVKVRPVGETAGDAPDAIVSRIQGALARGDLSGALAAWKSLPEATRAPSTAWASSVESRIRAETAVHSIMTEAVERLGQKQN